MVGAGLPAFVLQLPFSLADPKHFMLSTLTPAKTQSKTDTPRHAISKAITHRFHGEIRPRGKDAQVFRGTLCSCLCTLRLGACVTSPAFKAWGRALFWPWEHPPNLSASKASSWRKLRLGCEHMHGGERCEIPWFGGEHLQFCILSRYRFRSGWVRACDPQPRQVLSEPI